MYIHEMGAAIGTPSTKLKGPLGYSKCLEQCKQVSLDCILDRWDKKARTLCGFITISPSTPIRECYRFVSEPRLQCMHSRKQWESEFLVEAVCYLVQTRILSIEPTITRSPTLFFLSGGTGHL